MGVALGIDVAGGTGVPVGSGVGGFGVEVGTKGTYSGSPILRVVVLPMQFAV